MNSFFELGAVLSLGAFALLWITVAFLSNASAGILTRCQFTKRWMESANVLFWLRMLPNVFASVATLALVLPAFLKLEPRQTRETPEAYLIVLAALSIFLFATIAFRLVRSCWATARTLHAWRRGAEKIDCSARVPVFRVDIPGSFFVVIGISNPRIFIGREALASLEPEELRAAICHESAHVSAFDNCKRLLLSVTRLPRLFSGLRALDLAWAEAAECAADEETVMRQGIPALELSSALVKIARLRAPGDWPLVAASQLVVPNQPRAMAQRLRRLRVLLENPSSPSSPSRPKLPLFVAIVVVGYLMELPPLLAMTHRAMECLVR